MRVNTEPRNNVARACLTLLRRERAPKQLSRSGNESQELQAMAYRQRGIAGCCFGSDHAREGFYEAAFGLSKTSFSGL